MSPSPTWLEPPRRSREPSCARPLSPRRRPVQRKVGVGQDRSRRFYEDAFDLAERVIRLADDADFTGYHCAEYGQPGFFLLILRDGTAHSKSAPP